jgi:hypothetical protein
MEYDILMMVKSPMHDDSNLIKCSFVAIKFIFQEILGSVNVAAIIPAFVAFALRGFFLNSYFGKECIRKIMLGFR